VFERTRSVEFPSEIQGLKTLDLEVLCCIAAGDTCVDAANYLGLSLRRVKAAARHLARLFGSCDSELQPARARELLSSIEPPAQSADSGRS
jgi:hypothetical protein